MKYLTLTKRSFLSLNICRCISTELWKNDLNLDVIKQMEKYWFTNLNYDVHFDKHNVKDKYYALSMFPYPSGNLHLGHVRVYTICDTVARFQRLNGKNVFQPMGWDAFGLPAENAAIERGIRPDEWTEKNVMQMRSQLDRLHCTFDWQSELTTCSPDYYRWTQYIFLKMYDAGLVYQKEAIVNWDPVDETVLADEQVDKEGKSWRSGVKVEKKVLKQWFIRTTKFSQEMRENLNGEKLLDWDDIIDIQKNWIGECNGFSFDLKLEGSEGLSETNSLNVWVQDPASLLDAEFIVVQPETLVDILSNCKRDANGKLPIKAVNPFNNHRLPIYVSENVPYPFARDVYVGVPSKSEFDQEFSEKVGLECTSKSNTKFCSREEICEIAKKSGIGGYPVSSKMRDWLISRQRYWGTPIPLIHCSKCGVQPVPYEELPVKLPPLPRDYKIAKHINAFLKKSEWINSTCPKCGGNARRETDTLDTFVDSSWYYLRYTDVNNKNEPFNPDITNEYMPVDLYVGGKEHAVLHLFYARFVSHFLHSIGLLKHREPFRRLLCQGMVRGCTYKTKTGKYLKPDEIQIEGEIAKWKETGEVLTVTWEKMSKSKYNGVEPNEILDKYGVDITRLLLLYSVSPKSDKDWNNDFIADVLKWQHRIWLTIREFLKVRENALVGPQPWINMEKENEILRQTRNRYIRGATFNFKVTQLISSSISNLQGLSNALRRPVREVRKYGAEYEKTLAAFIIMLSPIMPYFASTLWFGFTSAPGKLNIHCEEINWNENILKQKWPTLDGDFEVPMYCRINNGAINELTIPCFELAALTTERAMTFAKKNKKIKGKLNKGRILDVKVKSYDNLLADLDIALELNANTVNNSSDEKIADDG